jgi:hypothetical protein
LSGLLSNHLGAIWHSHVCHSIQYRALEHQLFELIINLASLQPIAEDRLETEDLRASFILSATGSQSDTPIMGSSSFFEILDA